MREAANNLVASSLVESLLISLGPPPSTPLEGRGMLEHQVSDLADSSASVECIVSPSRALEHLVQDNHVMTVATSTIALAPDHSIKVQ